MYLSIIILPLLGSIVSGFFGRKVGVTGSRILGCLSIITTTILAIISFFEVGFNNNPISINLFKWLDSESFNMVWNFQFDSLTVSMLIPVLVISSLVHFYSIGYMSHDPHSQRFFSYLSLFTFMMIILVTGNNYLLMFVGWEGCHNSLKWLNLYKSTICNKIRNISSINNKDNTSLLIGSLLGNSYLKKDEKGVKFIFIKCSGNIEYLMKFYNHLISIGYCKSIKPVLSKVISKNNKVIYYWKEESYYLTQIEWLYDMFYKYNKKTIPLNLKEYLTPLCLSTWYLDNTDKLYLSSSQSFDLNSENIYYIIQILKDKYNIDTSYKLESKGKVAFYIENKSSNNFSDIVKPYLSSSLQYKLKDPHNKLTMWNNSVLSLRSSSLLAQNSVKHYSTSVKDIKYSAEYKKDYLLTDVQKEALIGIILGDGFIERAKPTHNARIRIEQSYPEKNEYLKSLHELLEALTAMEPTLLTRKNKKSGNNTQSLYFRTLAMPCLNYYYELFYKDNVKIVPRNLEELLTARGLAYWIMDDGGKSVHNQTILHTRSFNKEDVEYLQTVLNKNFELRTRLEEKVQDQWVIYIPVRQKIKLIDIVGPYMHKSMLYKV